MEIAGLQLIRQYFVDEAGDGILFNKRGKVAIQTPGCSRYFILGLAYFQDGDALFADLAELQARILADPVMGQYPSIRKRTYFVFHAKDDPVPIRDAVFNCISRHAAQIRFCAAIRDKHRVLEYVRQQNERDEAYRYKPDELYDYLVRRLFKSLLHKHDEYQIYFAKRGKADRESALLAALMNARRRFYAQWGIASDAPIAVFPIYPYARYALQVTDYCLWALQRYYERQEAQYIHRILPTISLVMDIDDTSMSQYGQYYTRKHPLFTGDQKVMPGV